MRYFNNSLQISVIIILRRLRMLDPHAIATTHMGLIQYDEQGNSTGQAYYAIIQSTLDDLTIENILSTPETVAEQTALTVYGSAASDFDALPNWATWTATEANTYITTNILNGWDQAQIDTWIDTNVTSLATTRAALKLLATSIISIRTILAVMGKAIIFIRDYTIRLRR